MPTLLIFIDSLPYRLSEKFIEDVDPTFTVKKIIPGAGFSNNIYAEIVTGLNPDQIGYFNEWRLRKNIQKPPFINRFLSVFDFLRAFIYLNAGLRRIILRKILHFESFNIPFKYLHFFAGNGSHNFRDIKNGNILHQHKFEIIDAAEIKKSVGIRDFEAIATLNKKITNKNTLLSLVDLDNIAHIYGMDSFQYSSHLATLAIEINKISQKFKSLSDKNKVILFSDHGMAPVNRGEYFELESTFGRAMNSEYIYFVDATYVRIWVKSVDLKEKIERYLIQLTSGKLIDARERIKFGITNPDFGDILFRANEGVMFAPNFFGARVCKAMHGYDPQLDSQLAFYASCPNAQKLETSEPKSTLDIYKSLKDII